MVESMHLNHSYRNKESIKCPCPISNDIIRKETNGLNGNNSKTMSRDLKDNVDYPALNVDNPK